MSTRNCIFVIARSEDLSLPLVIMLTCSSLAAAEVLLCRHQSHLFHHCLRSGKYSELSCPNVLSTYNTLYESLLSVTWVIQYCHHYHSASIVMGDWIIVIDPILCQNVTHGWVLFRAVVHGISIGSLCCLFCALQELHFCIFTCIGNWIARSTWIQLQALSMVLWSNSVVAVYHSYVVMLVH